LQVAVVVVVKPQVVVVVAVIAHQSQVKYQAEGQVLSLV